MLLISVKLAVFQIKMHFYELQLKLKAKRGLKRSCDEVSLVVTYNGRQGHNVHVQVSFARHPGSQKSSNRVSQTRLRNQVEVSYSSGN